jgi:hypothetical protein
MKKFTIIFILFAEFLLTDMIQAQNLPNLIPYRKGDKWGFCDSTKKIIISPKYLSVSFTNAALSEAYTLRMEKLKNKIYTDSTNKKKYMQEFAYNEQYELPIVCYAIWRAKNEPEDVYLTDSGKTIPVKLYEMHEYRLPISDPIGTMPLSQNVSKNYQQAVPLYENNSEQWIVKKSGKYGLIDGTGAVILPLSWDSILAEGYGPSIRVLSKGKWGVINPETKQSIEPKWDYIIRFSDFLYAVLLKDKWGLIDKKGTVILEPVFDNVKGNIPHLKNGYAVVSANGKYGFINAGGKVAVPLKYDFCYDMIDNYKLAEIIINGKNGYIDYKGTEYFED